MEILGIRGIVVLGVMGAALLIFLLHLHQRHHYSLWKISLLIFFIHIIVTLISPYILSAVGTLYKPENLKIEQLVTLLPGVNIQVFDATKHNAAIIGLGPTLTITYSSTSLEQAPVSELLAVGYHELGHAKYAHSIWYAAIVALLCYGSLWVLTRVTSSQSGIRWIASICVTIIALLIYLLCHRSTEWHADRFAKEMGQGEQLAAYLERAISNEQRDEQDWSGLKGMRYFHPSIVKRMEFLTQE